MRGEGEFSYFYRLVFTRTLTDKKCFKDQMYVIFLKSRGFKDFKYDMDMDMSNMDMDVVDKKTNTNTKTNTKSNRSLFFSDKQNGLSVLEGRRWISPGISE